MSRTLVIILGQTRAWEKTYDSFKENLLDPLRADLCVCIGAEPNYDTNNPYYAAAKYRFLYPEPEDWGDAFQSAADEISPPSEVKWTQHNDFNGVFGRLKSFNESTSQIEYLGRYPTIEDIPSAEKQRFCEIVYHGADFPETEWRYCAYGIRAGAAGAGVPQTHVTTLRREPARWREYLKVKWQWLGGILDSREQQPGSAAILIFMRWWLWKNLRPLADQYDNFIITRSDYYYRMPHISLETLFATGAGAGAIYVPDSEHYGGITDRHTVIPRQYMESYCSLLEHLIKKQDEYFPEMLRLAENWNLERVILYFARKQNIPVFEFPYVFYTVRPQNGTSRWKFGTEIDPITDSFIKYPSEYCRSAEWAEKWRASGATAEEFYAAAGAVRLLSRGPIF